jgi:hypothetical protein
MPLFAIRTYCFQPFVRSSCSLSSFARVPLVCTYVADNSVAIVTSYEILHRTRWCVLELISTYEVVCEVMLCSIGGRAVHDGHGAIRMRDTIPVDFSSGHDGELTAR